MSESVLQLSLQQADPRHRSLLPRRFVIRCLKTAVQSPAQLTVRIVGEAEGRALNRDYRGRDYATNVLTFDYLREPVLHADLVLCAPVVEREAIDQGLNVRDHYAHLLVHGALHALGWDHEEAAEAADMECLEIHLLATLDIGDPYGHAGAAPRVQAARSRRAASRAK